MCRVGFECPLLQNQFSVRLEYVPEGATLIDNSAARKELECDIPYEIGIANNTLERNREKPRLFKSV